MESAQENVKFFMRFMHLNMNAGDIKMNVCRYIDEHIGSSGLLYRYANKSRRKVSTVILFIISSLLFSTSFNICAGEDKIRRVDPLGTN